MSYIHFYYVLNYLFFQSIITAEGRFYSTRLIRKEMRRLRAWNVVKLYFRADKVFTIGKIKVVLLFYRVESNAFERIFYGILNVFSWVKIAISTSGKWPSSDFETRIDTDFPSLYWIYCIKSNSNQQLYDLEKIQTTCYRRSEIIKDG